MQCGNYFMKQGGPKPREGGACIQGGEGRWDEESGGEVLSYFLEFQGHGNKKCITVITIAMNYFYFQ